MRQLPVEFWVNCFFMLTNSTAVDLVYAMEANPRGGALFVALAGILVAGVVAWCALKRRDNPPAP
ncbi:hypothetical protein RBA41_28315 [Massilia sp. CCM 9210]|uniref:hypothetical protein n=1 Tax=Massilia scottii TaxID=3057166 RepID=UPI002796B507|nr:hypothetical protein [Massilia sp. CCM 9210]MDQ1817215.1 hypothetical protein [Massilia sp. CCM 9210]